MSKRTTTPDADGKPDLVKAIVQLPKAVAQGDFKAATILEARPYVAGTLDENYVTLEVGASNGR